MVEGNVSLGEFMKDFFHNWKGKLWFLINMLCTIIYLMWRMFFTIPFGYGFISVAAGIALLFVEVLGMVEAFIHYVNMYSVEDYKFPDVSMDDPPDVDVFIATYSEDVELIYKTIHGCKRMKYPDRSKVHIYLCDDGRRPEMHALAEKMGIHYLDRDNNEGAKAGNLNNALKHSSSPYIVTLDADMIPRSNFLMRTIPYFVDCEIKNGGRKEEDRVKLGFVQSPQSFYNLDLFQFNLYSESRIPNEQDYFYKDIQVARTKTNSVIYGGSNTVISREALEAVGGFYTEAITEDFATGILIEKKQFVSLGIGETLASGLSPNDLKGLIQQRTRWARGVIATGRKMHIFSSPEFTFSQKMNYWASIWYWYAPLKRLIYIMSPILYATFGFTVLKCTITQILLFWLPMYITSNISLRMLSRNIRTTKWTSIYETVLFPYLLVPILFETVGITMKKFKVTDKGEHRNEKGKNFIYTIPFLILILLSIIGIIRCVIIMLDSGSFGPIVVLFWLVYNLFLLIMSLFFVDGRIPYRKTERVLTEISCRLQYLDEVYEGITRNISEEGIAVQLDNPYYFEEGSEVDILLQTPDYYVEARAVIVHVSQQKNMWNFSMKFTDLNDCYDDLLGILYDRMPTVPKEIRKDSGSFEDLKLNLKKRTAPPFYQKRHYPRIILDASVACQDKGEEVVEVHDFNYVYITVKSEMVQEEIKLVPIEGIILDCRYESDVRMGLKLYRILNYKELQADEEKKSKLLEWLVETSRLAKDMSEYRKKSQKEVMKAASKEFDESELLAGEKCEKK